MKRLILTAASIFALAACNSNEPSTPADIDEGYPDTSLTEELQDEIAEMSDGDATADPQGTQLVVGRYVARVCEIPHVRFAFNSANVRDRHEPALEALATCFTTGVLKDAKLKLVGHADPRGTTTYNMALGQERAGEVAEYLMASGVSEKRISTSSRGELEADGNDEKTWADDRKVEVLVDM